MHPTAPIPRNSSRKPNFASSTSSRAFAYGTSGAHVATLIPARKNDARVAARLLLSLAVSTTMVWDVSDNSDIFWMNG
ncbi:hypothetical protein [Burkholderia sola]|uniref:hypothetical protein n=1 Tax=Burkholderia sola TaxID=2843302 RepID=UPI00209678D4